jgi:hypothetical protein
MIPEGTLINLAPTVHAKNISRCEISNARLANCATPSLLVVLNRAAIFV